MLLVSVIETVVAVGVVHVGARVVPADVKTCPAVPFANRPVIPEEI